MRRPLAVLAAVLLAVIVAVPAQAATIQRNFIAGISGGANGSVQLEKYVEGTGRVTYSLTGLRGSTTFKVKIYRGKCGNLGKDVTALTDIKTTSSGTLDLARSLTTTKMNRIWEANWSARLAIKLIHSSGSKCGNLNFVSASRVRIPRQNILDANIDLAVVRGPNGYPYCNVGMYMGVFAQPTEPGIPGVSFVYAHARTGMFLPLLDEWRAHGDNRLVGLLAYVYTSDNQMHTYEIKKVWKAKGINMNTAWTEGERLWLQTSTGPNFTYPKLFLQARRVSSETVSWSEAHPKAKIVKCH